MPHQDASSSVVADGAHTMRGQEERQADPATRLMVDEMILDYLLYMGSKVILEDRKAEKRGMQSSPQDCRAELYLSMVDDFLTVFKASHPNHPAPVGMQFRLHLLRFTTLLMHRVTQRPSTLPLPTLMSIRSQNRERASVWLSHRDQSSAFPAQIKPLLRAYDTALPLPKATLLRNRQHVSSVLKAKSDPLFYGLPSCPSLLDSLPEFMTLSAAQMAMIRSSTITKAWMSLAARYMTQSVLEQYLIYGGQGSEPLLEAFAWGFIAGPGTKASSNERRTNAMFWGEDGEVEEWQDLRDRHIRAFIPEPGESLDTHLENLASRNSIDEFENGMITFLEASLMCQPKPILAQMELAELDGLSRLETDLLKQRVGFTG